MVGGHTGHAFHVLLVHGEQTDSNRASKANKDNRKDVDVVKMPE